MNEHYAAVLADLRVWRARLEEEIEEIDGVIAGMERLAQVGASTAPPSQPIIFEPSPPMMPTRSANGPLFANISMRWSVLWHLTEFAKGFQKTGEITASLRENGYQTAAANLGNMVSAVLSSMKAKGEVESSVDGGYRITDAGRATWNLIKQGNKFKEAMASTNVQPQPSER